MLKSIVFDLDGTLIDSPLNFATMKKAAGIPEDEYIIEYLDTLDASSKKEKLKIIEEMEIAAAKEAVIIDGALKILLLAKEQNILTGILTRNCRAVANNVVSAFRLPISKIITREDAKAKPDPDGLNVFLKSWNQNPSEMLYVGDFRFDIECGKNAGVKTGLFTAGKPVEDNYGADFVFNSYQTLVKQLQESKLI